LLYQFISRLLASIGKQFRGTGEVNNLDMVIKLLMTIEEPQKTAAIQTTEFLRAEGTNFTPHRVSSIISQTLQLWYVTDVSNLAIFNRIAH